MTRSIPLRRTVAAFLATAAALTAGCIAAPAASALPTAPPPTDYATWHRVDLPTGGSGVAGAMTTDRDGAVWYSDSVDLVRIDPATGRHDTYPLGLTARWMQTIDAAPDGSIWFSDSVDDQVGRLDPVSGAVTLIPLGGRFPWQPQSIVFDAAGNAWFGGSNMGASLTVVRPDGTSEVFRDPTDHMPQDLAVAADGRIWFVEQASSDLHIFDPALRTFSSVSLGAVAGSGSMEVETSKSGRIWAVTTAGTAQFADDGTLIAAVPFATGAGSIEPADLVAGEFAEMYFVDVISEKPARVESSGDTVLVTAPFADADTQHVTVDGNGALWFDLKAVALGWV